MIEAANLTMHYGPVKALQDASFEVHEGELVGLVGPNGAGKSTTMKILTTYLYPTAGRAKVAGFDVLSEPIEVRRRIGYLPEVLPLYMDMEVSTYLSFVGRARGLEGARLRERTDWVLARCGLESVYRKIISELSKGFRQRTGLAQALIHDPEVVILDEPTSGLDPHQILEVRELVRELAQTKTVILSTHILQEVQATADRIVIINRGQIVGNGTLDELRHRAQSGERARIGVKAKADEAKKAIEGIDGVEEVQPLGDDSGFELFEVKAPVGNRIWRSLGDVAAEKGWTLCELGERPFSLEETFLALTEAQVGDSAGKEVVA